MAGVRTLRGRIDANSQRRLVVDDGNFTSGFKVKSFCMFPLSLSSGGDVEGVLGLDYDIASIWNASDNRQIAWACMTTTNTTRVMNWEKIDPDHIVVRDLYLYNMSDISANYLIEIEPVTISEDEAVIALIKERSQDDLR